MILFFLYAHNFFFVQMVYVLSVYNKKEKNHRIMVSGFSSHSYIQHIFVPCSCLMYG